MRRIKHIEELTGPQSRRPYATPDGRTVSRRHARKGLRRCVVLALSALRGRITGRE